MRLSVADLVDHPGQTRELRRAVARTDLTDDGTWGPADEALVSDIDLDLDIECIIGGILVRGEVAFDVQVPCARCTEPLTTRVVEEVAELFVDPTKADPDDEWDEGYELLDDRTAIDLSTMLRDLVVLDLPTRAVHTDDDGQVACDPPAVEGVELRTEEEDERIRASTPDPRWAALADLELPANN